MAFATGFIIGIVVGAVIGVFIMALVCAGKLNSASTDYE